MIARRTARRADVADDVALLHMLPRLDDEARHMPVARLDRIAMFDFDIIAEAAEARGAADGAVGGGEDRGDVGRGIVEAGVEREKGGEGMDARKRQRVAEGERGGISDE